jgi:hypothetical protein
MASLDTSDRVFRLALDSSMEWLHCAVGQLNPSVAARFEEAKNKTEREGRTVEEFHDAVLREVADPTLTPLYRLGVAFDETVDAEWPRDIRGLKFSLYEVESAEFPTSRAIFDEIARLSEGSTVG